MATYRGMDVPDHLHGVLPHMRLVEATREALLILGQQWDLLDVLSRVVQTGTQVDRTRTDFQALNAALIAALGDESLNKLVGALAAKAQVSVDIVIRNLFERTADIGFLATDDDLRDFLKGGDGPSPDAIHARLIEYRDKYSVYENVVLMDAEGKVRAQAGTAALPALCADPWVARALVDAGSYLETFAPSDLSPGGASALIYAARVAESGGPAARVLGVLALVFRFADELDGVFAKLLAPEDWTVLALLDASGAVLACSDVVQLPLASRLLVDPAKDYQFIRHAGRRYIAATRTTKGYQGYLGPGWRGCALIPVEGAFEENDDSRVVLADRHYRAIAGNPRLFSETVRGIPQRADAVQAELNRTVWNGKLAMSRLTDASDPATDDNAARRTLLSEISAAGSRTQQVFADAVGALNRTAIGTLIENCAFSAALAVDLMDRNLYERANDCRWWALTTRFRQILTTPMIDEAARAEMTEILTRINDLYTVYTNLILFDRHGLIQAVSDPRQGALVGTPLPPKLAQRLTARAETAFYGVSDFVDSPLYDDRATYIYGAPVLREAAPHIAVGGIAIVFDAEPQFRAMLDDAGLFQAAGRLASGSRSLFVDAQRRIIASTAADDVIGTTLEVPADLLTQATARPLARVLAIGGELFAVGIGASIGYREYKGPGDAYRNPVFAVSLLHLGADDAVAMAAPPARTSSATAPRRDAGTRRELATFAIGNSRFAFDRNDIVEAILPDHIAPAPNTPVSIAGYVPHGRGSIIILDARDHLGLLPLATDATRPVIVFQGRGRLLGLQVDSLGGILDIDTDRIGRSAVGEDAQIVKAVVRADPTDGADMLLLLDADMLTQVLLPSSAATATDEDQPRRLA
ncbi:CheW domain-containing protein [Sphingomonas sp.]|uniref:chemotaxis protein CheW n=1 Tax=Sphingomonas sp. TaxID=28214 RepID=UPI002ED922A9